MFFTGSYSYNLIILGVRLLVEVYLLIVSVVLLEWVCGQITFVCLMRWFLTANVFIHNSVWNLTCSLSYHLCSRLMWYALSGSAAHSLYAPLLGNREQQLARSFALTLQDHKRLIFLTLLNITGLQNQRALLTPEHCRRKAAQTDGSLFLQVPHSPTSYAPVIFEDVLNYGRTLHTCRATACMYHNTLTQKNAYICMDAFPPAIWHC